MERAVPVTLAGEVEPPVGGGLLAEELVRAPVPQGILAPVPGWVCSVGGVVLPLASAMAKRVVQ